MNPQGRFQRCLWPLLYAATAVCAGAFVWCVGHRGIFFLDQSAVFDGGWRLLQGQVPYRDFYWPYGPVVLFIQCLFFMVAGVDFSSMVLSAAVLNTLATACVIRVVRILWPAEDQRPTALAAGLLTAVWFQAPFGTLWLEQTSAFFNLVALVLLLEAVSKPRAAPWLRLAAGMLLPISILSKQNAGVLFAPIAVGAGLIPCLRPWRRGTLAALQILAGMALATAVFVGWLWTFSSPSGFWQSVVVMSRALAAERIPESTIWNSLWLSKTWRRGLAAVVVAAIAFARLRPNRDSRPGPAVSLWIIAIGLYVQNLFALQTSNEVENDLPYLGLINALSLGAFEDAFRKAPATGPPCWMRRLLFAPLAVVLLAVPALDGAGHSWTRNVQNFDRRTRFDDLLQVPGASRIRWGEPTRIGPRTTLSRKDFEDLNAWLASANANFFVFPDSTVLYGLHKRVSPQPWLYFTLGHSILESDMPRVDAEVVAALQRNNVTVIVLEEASHMWNHAVLERMPRLRAWIRDDFQLERKFGHYGVWTRRAGRP